MKVFISYSTTDKGIAGDLFRQMAAHGIYSFLAHETIEIAADWKGRILQELSTADAMVVLLSNNFLNSKWTGHEVGYFYAHTGHQGPFIPLSLDETVSCGIIENLQSQRIPTGAKSIPIELWLAPLINAFPDRLIPVVIAKVVECKWCRTSEAYMRILRPHFATMEKLWLDQLIVAATNNPCIFSARECRNTHIPGLVEANTGRLSSVQVAGLQQRLDSDEVFRDRVILPTSTMAEDEHGN